MNDLTVAVIDGEPRVDSRLMASQLGVEHESFRKIIRDYQADFEEFGVCRFEIAKPIADSAGGRPEKFALLNEDQAYLGLAYCQNTEQARTLKKGLVKAFADCRKALAQPAPSLDLATMSTTAGIRMDVLALLKTGAYAFGQVLKTPQTALLRSVIAAFFRLSDWFCSYGQGGLVRKAGRTSVCVFSHPVRPAENRDLSLANRSIRYV